MSETPGFQEVLDRAYKLAVAGLAARIKENGLQYEGAEADRLSVFFLKGWADIGVKTSPASYPTAEKAVLVKLTKRYEDDYCNDGVDNAAWRNACCPDMNERSGIQSLAAAHDGRRYFPEESTNV